MTQSTEERRPGERWALDEADSAYTRRWGAGKTPDDGALARLQESLERAASEVMTWATRNVAHRDPRGPLQSLTYAAIDDAISDLCTIVNDIERLLTTVPTSFDCIWFTGDWQAPSRAGLFSFDSE